MSLYKAYEADQLAEFSAIDAEAARRAKTKRKLAALAQEHPINRIEARALGRTAARDAMRIITEHRTSTATNYAWAEFNDDDDNPPREHQDEKTELLALCEGLAVAYPESDFGRDCEIARLKDAGWWGRKIRVADWRDYETRQLRLGRVRQFVSDEIAGARKWHRAAIAQLLEGLTAIRDDDGAIMSLADLMKTSTAHLPIRRAEMLVRFKGVATACAARGWTWTFITLTAPSKYHRMRTRRDQHGRKVLMTNPRWDDAGGPTPRETQAYHNKVWSRIRAELGRKKIRYSALRTVEPHADGTPHWHMAVFTHPDNLAALKAIFRKHALREDGEEAGAEEHRFTAKDYNPAEGEMVDRCIAYLIAYVAKNIDGEGVLLANDDGGEGEKIVVGEAIDMARRVEAWATLWGIRQFQIAGGGKVTGYRELRRLRAPILHDMMAEVVRLAADRGDYAGYMRGAEQYQLELWTDKTAAKLCREAKAAGIAVVNDDGSPTPEVADLAIERNLFNRWGEPIRHYVYGVVIDGRHHGTRLHSWRVVSSAEVERIAHDKAAQAFYGAAALGRYDALALAPGSCFSRAAQPRALGPVSLTVRGAPPEDGAPPPDPDDPVPYSPPRRQPRPVKHPDYLHYTKPWHD